MRDDYFNPATYAVIDRVTGEEIDVAIFLEKASSKYWERAYAKTIAEYIGVGGNGATKVLAYIIKEKNVDNILIQTVRGIGKETSVDPKTVSEVLKTLREKDLVKKMRNGVYLVSPHLMRHGSKTRGAMLLRLWEL